MSPEQERALALARARRRRAEAESAARQPNQLGPQIPGIDTPIGPDGRLLPDPNAKRPGAAEPLSAARGVGGALDEMASQVPGVDTAAALVGQAGRGARQGVANVLGLPVDAMNAAPRLFNLLPGEQGATSFSPEPFMGSAFIDRALGGFGAIPEPPAPRGVAENVSRRVGQELGASVLPAVGALAKANQVGVEGARALRGPFADLVESAAVDPVRFAQREMTTATAAGLGAGLANAATGSEPGGAADLVGAIMGAGTAGLAGVVGPVVKNTASAVVNPGGYMDDATRRAVTDTLMGASGVETVPGQAADAQILIDTIMNGRRVADVVPGFRDSLADRTGSPGLASLEYGRQSGPNSGAFNERRQQNMNAADQAISALEPQGAPGAFRDALDAERQTRLDAQAARTEAARTEFEAAMAKVQPTGSDTGRGSDIRAALEDAKAAARKVEGEAWSSVAGPVDPAPLDAAFQGVTKSLTDAERLQIGDAASAIGLTGRWVGKASPNDPMAAITGRTVPAAGPATVDVREVTGLRSALTDAIRSSYAARNENRARILQRYVAALDGYADTALPPEIKSAYDAARQVSFDLNERFTRPNTAIAQTLQERGGAYALDPSAVPGRFVQPDRGRTSDYAALKRETGGQPNVQEAVQGQIAADAQPLVSKPGQIDTFRAERQTMLRDFPELDQRLAQAADTGRVYAGAQRNDAEARRFYGEPGRPGSSAVGKYLTYGDEKSAQAMTAVINARDPAKAIDDLVAFAGNDPQAIEGAKRAFWSVLEKRARSRGETTASMAGAQPWMPRAMLRFLDDPSAAAVAERLWRDDPQHLADVREIADALRNVDVRSRAKAPATSGTAQGVNPLLTPETLQSRLYALQSGRISGSFFLTALASVTGRRAVGRAREIAFNRLLDDALLNPEVAAALLQQNNPANRAALARKAKLWFGNEASTMLQLLNGEPEQQSGDRGLIDRIMENVP